MAKMSSSIQTFIKDIILPILIFAIVIINKSIFVDYGLEDFVKASVLIFVGALTGGFVGIAIKNHQLENNITEFKKCNISLNDTVEKYNISLNDTVEKYNSSLNDAVENVNAVTSGVFEQFKGSLICKSQLIKIEDSVEEGGEIWVLTSALELEGGDLNEVIRRNIDKKIQYVYLIPDDRDMKRMMLNLCKDWINDCNLSEEDANKLIKCFLVPAHFAYMTVIVYNAQYAHHANDKSPTVIVKFPSSKNYKDENYPFMYRIKEEPRDAWKNFVDAISDFIDDEPICKNTRQLQIFELKKGD